MVRGKLGRMAVGVGTTRTLYSGQGRNREEFHFGTGRRLRNLQHALDISKLQTR
jgi:hypothetical protein